MTKNNHQSDLPCAFTETLVALLYGEATTVERQEFRKHFNNCASCREELVSFGSIRDVIAEWRAADLDPVKTPSIVLPEIEKLPIGQTPKISWSERVRTFLFPSGGQMPGAAAFAALAVGVLLLGVFGYALNHFALREVDVADAPRIAQTEPVSSAPLPTPVVEVIPTPQVKPQSQENSANDVKASSKAQPAVVKTGARQDKVVAPLPQHQQAQPVAPRRPVVTTLPKPAELAIESVDDLEDNSLRLTDLLDDAAPSM